MLKTPLNYRYITSFGIALMLFISLRSYSRVAEVDGGIAVTFSKAGGTAPCNMQVTDSLQNIVCVGACNGGIFIKINNGQAPYQFHWSDGTTTQNRQSLCPGVYKLTILDANGCGDTSVHFLAIAHGPQLQLQSTLPSCNGKGGGTLSIGITGGNPPFTFHWSTGDNAPAISNVRAGVYVCVVKDAKGCSYSGTDTVKEPDPVLPFTSKTDEYCNQSNGSITLTVNGGIPPYNFSWNNGSTLQNLAHIPAGNYSVTVKDINNCSAATSITIGNIINTPFVSATPLNAKICSGSSFTLNVKGAVSYAWAPATGLNTTTGSCVSARPLVNTTYTVTGADANGCSAAVAIPLTVYSAVDVAISPTHPAMCSGGSAGLNVSGAATYQWTDNGKIFNTTSDNIVVIPAQTTTYKIMGTDLYGCIGYDSVTVTVNLLPKVSALANDSLFCAGNTVSLTANTTSTGSIYYSWSAAGKVVGSTKQISIKQSENTDYTITITDANNCAATNHVQVNVKPGPIVILNTSDTSLCAGEKITLSYSGANSYTWASSAGIISSNNSKAIAAPTSTSTYIITGTDKHSGCITSQQVVVTVHSLPHVKITSSGPGACVGSALTLYAGGAEQYEWSTGNAITTSKGSSLITTLTHSTKFFVTGSDAFGCLNGDSMTVNIYPKPIASFSPSVTNGCAPLGVLFNNTSTHAGGCNWFVNDKPVSTDSVFHYVFEEGEYYIKLITAGQGACADTAILANPITVLYSPQAKFIVAPDVNMPVLISDALFTFSNYSRHGNRFTWNFGDNTNSDAANPSHKYSKTGSYTVTLTAIASNGCADSVKKSSLMVTEAENAFLPNTFSPNDDGSNDVFKIYGTGIKKASFSIYDRGGELLYHTDNNVPWNGTFKGKELSIGVYVCTADIEYFTGKKESRQGDITLLR